MGHRDRDRGRHGAAHVHAVNSAAAGPDAATASDGANVRTENHRAHGGFRPADAARLMGSGGLLEAGLADTDIRRMV